MQNAWNCENNRSKIAISVHTQFHILSAVACSSKWKDCQKLPATGFRYSSKIRTFWAYFEEKRARNACARAKRICYGKIRLCAMSCGCIFWHVEYFYHHKNYMVRYYTLYSIFYNWFFIQRYQFLHVTTRMQKNRFLAVFFWFSPVYWSLRATKNWLRLPVHPNRA